MNLNFIFVKLRNGRFFCSNYFFVLIILTPEILILNPWWWVVVSLIIGFQFSLCIAGNRNHLFLCWWWGYSNWKADRIRFCFCWRAHLLSPLSIAHWPLHWQCNFDFKEVIQIYFLLRFLRKYELLPGLSLKYMEIFFIGFQVKRE